MLSIATRSGLPLLLCLGLGCGGTPPPAPAPPPPPNAPDIVAVTPGDAGATAAPSAPPRGEAHKLVVALAGCWFGGVWSEGEGADTPETRKAASEARCHDATRRALGADEKEKYEQLRALEANAVEDAAKKVADVAKDDSIRRRAQGRARQAGDDARRGEKRGDARAPRRRPREARFSRRSRRS